MKKLNAYLVLSLCMTGINRELRKLHLRSLSKPPIGNVKLKHPCPDRADCTWVAKVSVMRNRVWVLVNVSRGLKYRQMSLHKLCLILAIAAPDYSGYGDFLGFEKV